MDQSNNECEASELASESARRELGSSGSIDGNGNDDDDDESKNVNSDLRDVNVSSDCSHSSSDDDSPKNSTNSNTNASANANGTFVVEEDDNEDNEEEEINEWMFTQNDDRGAFSAFGSDAGLLTQIGPMSGGEDDESESDNDNVNVGDALGGCDDPMDGSPSEIKSLSDEIDGTCMVEQQQQQQQEQHDERDETQVDKTEENEPLSETMTKSDDDPINSHNMDFAERANDNQTGFTEDKNFADVNHGDGEKSWSRSIFSKKDVEDVDSKGFTGDSQGDGDGDGDEDEEQSSGLNHVGATESVRSQDLECTEDTLVVEESLSPSPLKMNQNKETKRKMQESQNAWKGFTEDEKVEEYHDENQGANVHVQCGGHSRKLSFDAMQPGFTEDSDIEGNIEAGSKDDDDCNSSSRMQDEDCGAQPVTGKKVEENSSCNGAGPEFAQESVNRGSEGNTVDGPAADECARESTNTFNEEGSGGGSSDAQLANQKKSTESNEQRHSIMQDMTSLSEKIDPGSERAVELDMNDETGAEKILERDLSPAKISGQLEDLCDGSRDENDKQEDGITGRDIDETSIYLSIFTGDTQPIPSQFPLTLQDEKEDSQRVVDVNNNTNATCSANIVEQNNITTTPITKTPVISKTNESVKSPQCGSHSDYTNDSYYGGSTEELQSGSLLTPQKDKSMHDKQSTGNPGYEESATKESSKPSSLRLVGDEISPPSNKNSTGEILGDSLNYTATPNDDEGLSYPQDYLGGNVSQDESKLSHKASSGTETLTITPHSQILLEPAQTVKKPTFSVADKVVGLKSRARSVGVNDEISDSSDEEDAAVDDLNNQAQGSVVVRDRPAQTQKDGHFDVQSRNVENATLKTHLVSTPSKEKSPKERYILKSPLSVRSNKTDDEGDTFVNDSSQPLRSSPLKNSPRRAKKIGSEFGEKTKPTLKSQSDGGWLKSRREKIQHRNKRDESRYESEISDEETQLETPNKNSGFEDSVEEFEKSGSLSGLEDTQPGNDDDDDDDVPLISLRSASKRNPSPLESSDEENEFTDDWDTTVQPSQTTRAIKSQLQKFEDMYDVRTLKKKLKAAQGSDDVSSKREMKILRDKNKVLDNKNKQIMREKESLRKQLVAANAQLNEKNDLLAQMKERLDEYQPILEAVQKLGLGSQSAEIPRKSANKKTPRSKSKRKLTPSKSLQKKPIENNAESDNEINEDHLSNKKIFRTPKGKKIVKQSVSIVSVSNRKIKQKIRNRGNITFNNLWKMLQSNGWKHKNGPEPYNQVYVPPDGSVRLGSKLGVDFFEANDLWKKAEELGLIDGDDEADFLQNAVAPMNTVVTTRSKSGIDRSRIHSPDWRTESPQHTKNSVETVTPIAEDAASHENVSRELENASLRSKNGTMTEKSMSLCTSLIQNFLQLSRSGHFMRNLFGPMWDCLSNKQGLLVKETGWRYCKSTRRGSDNLGRDYWFCPPNSKGSKGFFGKDYFTTEEAVVAHILRELKTYDAFAAGIGSNLDALDDLEIKLSRAIEQHIPYDEIKNTALSDSKRSGRRQAAKEATASNTKRISPPAKRRKVEQDDSDGKSRSSISDASTCTIKTGHKSPVKSLRKSPNAQSAGNSPEKMLFSQKTVQGAEILLQLNNGTNQTPHQDEYNNRVTKGGLKELLKFRRRAGAKRKSEEKKEDEESPRKRVRLSPPAMCHLTQAPEDSEVMSFVRTPQIKRLNNSHKNLPLSGLFFFGSGVNDEVRRAVDTLGGTFLDDLQKFLQKNKIKMKLFFISNVRSRRTHKYILACALGVPMLDMEWVFALKKEFQESEKKEVGRKMPGAFDNRRYIRYRLPLGLSNETGLFILQRASHAKHWSRPTSDSGKLLFDGIRIVVSLEKAEFEKKWAEIMKLSGATLVNSIDIDKKGTKVDIILVDSLLMPPHVTAVPSRLGKILNKAAAHQPNAIIVDLSWATQCIVQRKLLETDDDKRYRVDLSQNNSPNKNTVVDIFSIKVKQFDSLTRYEVGDSVSFGRHGKEYRGRITSIRYNRKTRKTTVTVKVLEINHDIELMDGGKGVNSVEIDKSELQGHIVILGGKDFGDVAWSKASNIFRQKKA